MLTLGSLVGAAMTAVVGVAGDRFGRRPMLIGIGLLGAVGAFALALTALVPLLVVASGLGGISRGGGPGSRGAFGPFLPVEQPLVAGSVAPNNRTRAFGRLGFLGVLGAAAGSIVAGLPALLHHGGLSWTDSYRAVFALGGVSSLLVALVSLPLREPHRAPPRPREPVGGSDEGEGGHARHTAAAPAGLSTRQLIGRFALTNALNGFGFGFLGPLLTYWFHVRFGAGPAELGALYTVVNLVGALPYLGAHRISDRLGAVRTVVVTRTASIVMLGAMALVPGFLLAGLFLNLRTIFNALGMPARQSYAMGAADERRRGTVAALGSLPSLVTSSISPVVGGALMADFVDVPIVGAVVFMTANIVAYYLAFRHAPLPGEPAWDSAARRRAGLGAPGVDEAVTLPASGTDPEPDAWPTD